MATHSRQLGGMVSKSNRSTITYREEVYRIVSAAGEVFRELGYGHAKDVYEAALGLEFITESIPYKQHLAYDINYKEHKVGEFMTDMIVFNTVMVEIHVMTDISDIDRARVLTGMQTAQVPVGLIMNFTPAGLETEHFEQ